MAAEARWRAWPHGPVRRARRGLERGGERAGGDLAAACRACPTHAAPDDVQIYGCWTVRYFYDMDE